MIGSKHIGITEEILDQLGSRWTKKEGETRWYVDGVREKVGTWCRSEFSGVKVWLDAEGAVHVDHCLHEAVAKDIVEKIGRMVEEAIPAPVEEAAEVPAEDVEAMTAWTVVEVSAQAEAEAPAEEATVETATIWVTREDGEVAKVDLPHVAEDDLWTAIDREFPTAWAMMDENGVLAEEVEHQWDARFRAGEDEELALWLAEAMTEYHGALDGQDAVVDAVRSEGIAVVTWIVDGREARQTIALNPGDFERLAVGHDPIAEQWEDGCGNLVCVENAEGEQ